MWSKYSLIHQNKGTTRAWEGMGDMQFFREVNEKKDSSLLFSNGTRSYLACGSILNENQAINQYV